MAWQLIYTSAPRLLEAGRSGFGTVARHRQISPLLVSAIERASQFARLPGLGSARVIYCHRIVAVSGGRFHVLSCIRDSGADYTGRTNHLAHHVIAESREVAALGSRGASPADVLLGMRWLSAWDEAPRFLEVADEIALAHFPPAGGDAWGETTGDARHAWLLVSGEASRGAFLLFNPGTDLRALFAESLRLAPDRLWQIPFSTALQPSDETSDFRWIGIEAESALVAQIESSSRPVLNLARPETLPAPEVPANAAIATLPRPSALAAGATASPPIERSARPQPRPSLSKNVPLSTAGKKSGARKWMIVGGAIATAGVIGLAVIHPRMAAQDALGKQRADLRQRIVACHVFTGETTDAFAGITAEQLSPADAVLAEIEKALEAVKSARFDRMHAAKTGDELSQIASASGLHLPVEMRDFADRVRRFESLHSALAAAKSPTAPERAAYDAVQKQSDAIESLAKDPQTTAVFSPALEELRLERERAEAKTLLALMHPRGSKNETAPPAETALVETRLARKKPADAAAAKDFAEAEKLMAAWKAVPSTASGSLAETKRNARGVWPPWLIREVNTALAKARGDKATAPEPAAVSENSPALPLYFFNGLAALNVARFPELEKSRAYEMRPSPGAPPVPLFDPVKQGKLRRQISEPVLFSVDEAARKITTEHAAESIPRPFIFIAKGEDGADTMQLWVVNDSDKPLLPKVSGGLSRSGTTLTLAPSRLGLAGLPKSRLTLRMPPTAALAGVKAEPLVVKDWTVDLTALQDEIARSQKEAERQIAALEMSVVPPKTDELQTRLSASKKVIADAVKKETDDWAKVERARVERKESDEKKREPLWRDIETKRIQRIEQAEKDFGEGGAALIKQAGGCIKALCQSGTFQGHDALFSAGAELCLLDAKADAKTLAAALGKAQREATQASRNLFTSEDKGRYLTPLREILAILTLFSPETPELKAERAAGKTQLVAKREELRRIAAHPLLSAAVPPGVYRLSVMADGVEIPWVEIEIAH